jgi:cytochrome bd-type quinol oxidase subunit 1
LTTAFDFLTVGCFVCIVAAYFLLTDREIRTLAHLLVSGAAFAVANQLGNAGSTILALLLVVAGGAYAVFVVCGYGRPPR